MSAWVSGAVAVAGAVSSADASRKAAHDARDRSAPLEAAQLEAAQRKNRIADRLEILADKMLNDEPISGAERAVINQAAQVANATINRESKAAMEQALGAQAATGFLKSGRTADQIRKLSLESAEARQRIALQQQQAVVGGLERNKAQAIQMLMGSAGVNIPNFQQFEQGLQPGAVMGAGLTQLGGAGLELAGDLAKAEAIKNAGSTPKGGPSGARAPSKLPTRTQALSGLK